MLVINMRSNLELFYIFFKIGLFTFGGGYAMIPQLKEIVVEKKKWITEDEMLEIIAIAESTPGPIAINVATFIGYKQKKFLGSLFSTLGVTLPSFIIIFIISLFFKNLLSYEIVQYAFIGIKCAIAFLIIKAGIEMLIKMDKKLVWLIVFIVSIITLIILQLFNINFSSILFIVLGGIIGIFVYAISSYRKKENI